MREARAGNGYRWTRTHRKVFSAGRRSGVRHWITWYNSGRPHQALGYLSPADYRAQKLQHVACFRGSTTLTSVTLLYRGNALRIQQCLSGPHGRPHPMLPAACSRRR
ncbi:integrase core domain-containing protein [Desulfocurvibacter africanus]|uniref:integrase core domain-containing protein n=1 Tax=Desulfocurvibacter africanus TaxID=873 RepID=UPI00110C6547